MLILVYSMLKPERRDISAVTIKKLCDGLDMCITDTEALSMDGKNYVRRSDLMAPTFIKDLPMFDG